MTDKNRDLNTIKLFVGFIATVIAAFILKVLSNIFLPLGMALLLYFLLNGVVKKLVRLKIPRFIVLTLLIIFIFTIFYTMGILIYSGAGTLINNIPTYVGKVLVLAKGFSEKLHIPINEVEKYIATIDWGKSVDIATGVLSKSFGSFTAFVGDLVLVLVYLMFMLAGGESLTGRIGKAFKQERSTKIKAIIDDIEIHVRQYLSIKTFIGILHGVVAGIIIFIAGVDFVLFLAFLFTVLNYIPNIGSIIAVIVPVVVCLLQYGLTIRLFLLLGGLMIVQFAIANFLEPRLTGRTLNLSPIVILVSLIFWGYLWGIVGMILSVPLTSAIKITCENIPTLKPIADLISAE